MSDGHKLRRILIKLIHHCILICFTIIYFATIPVFFFLLFPVYIFRLIASQSRKILRPDLDKLVNTRSVVLAVDGFPDKPYWNIVVWLTMEEILDLEKFRKDFYDEHVQERDANGKLVYPEYQQHLEKWWGFYFWRWDLKFDIRNHIREYDGKLKQGMINDEDLLQIIKELTWAPWNSKRSPWEFLQIPNYQGKSDPAAKSILIFRLHHVLGDGYAVLKLIMQDICGISLGKVVKPKFVQRNTWERFVVGTSFWLRSPYQFVKMMVESRDVNPWHLPEDKLKRPLSTALSEQISLDFIKSIKDFHGVSFTAVIMAAVAGGIRKIMIEQGITTPKDLYQGVPIPLPGHPMKLRNHFIISFIRLPVGTADPLKRLFKAEKFAQDLKKSSVPMLNFLKVPLIGGMFAWMMPLLLHNRQSTCIMSNFPGTPEVPSINGVKVLDLMFGVGLGPGNACVGFTLISYVNHIRLLSVVDRRILATDAKVEELNEKILQELQVLKNLGTV